MEQSIQVLRKNCIIIALRLFYIMLVPKGRANGQFKIWKNHKWPGLKTHTHTDILETFMFMLLGFFYNGARNKNQTNK